MDMIEAGDMSLPALRKAIRANRVSFPSQIPLFVRNAPSTLQRYSVQLYFLCGWSCRKIAERYKRSHFYVWQILNEWKRHAAALGYIQRVPPARVLEDLRSALQSTLPSGTVSNGVRLAAGEGENSPATPIVAAGVSRQYHAGAGQLTRTPPSRRVLVVGNETALRKVIGASLATNGFVVEEAETAREAIGFIQQLPFDLILLDMDMPGFGAVEACSQIHALAPRAGIVMIAMSGAEEDIARALDAGADDYLAKPFHFRELMARVRVVLRRTQAIGQPDGPLLSAGDISLDLDRRLIWKRGGPVQLSPKEFDLLALLMRSHGAPLPHTKLLHAVWGPEYVGQLDYLRTYIRMLRRKVEDAPARPQYILTEPRIGYRFCVRAA
jgi:two-component system, OmpR family, KDP operon response regulator KdpE